jgi:hypothetical protein
VIDMFSLLPAVHRLRDHAQGDPLRALLAVIGREAQRLEDDIEGLYENWFIETCDEWVVPYIGDLLGVRGLLALDDPTFSQRGYVAHTLGYRRRKGTAGVLEQLGRDLTGWPSRAVESFELLVTTQHVNHPRPQAAATLDIRGAYMLQDVGTPFEVAAHTAEVRHIDNRRGRYNIPDVALFLWRLQSYPLAGVTARPLDATRYLLDPLGRSLPLFTVPNAVSELEGSGRGDVPEPISRTTLHHDLDLLYGDEEDPASVTVTVGGTVWDRSKVIVCNLADDGSGWAHEAPPDHLALDPVLGRVAFADPPTGAVAASFATGFGGDVGGGPYDKRDALAAFLADGVTWQVGVMADPPPNDARIKSTLVEAVQEWNQLAPGSRGVIVIMESRTLDEDLDTAATRIEIPQDSHLVIVAGQWPEEETDDPTQPKVRATGRVVPRAVRPNLLGTIEVLGTAPAGSPELGRLALVGLLVEGTLRLAAGRLGSVLVSHCTLAPGTTTLTVAANPDLQLVIERSIVSDVTPGSAVPTVVVDRSIVDGQIDGRALRVESSTVFGTVAAESIEASSSIFVDDVVVERRQEGCLRFCYAPMTSSVPRRFRCQPADSAAADTVFPTFVSDTFGDPSYAVLATTCPAEIAEGAEGEDEMGVWRFVQVPRRVRNLRRALDEYLRFGLEAGVFFAPQRLLEPGTP